MSGFIEENRYSDDGNVHDKQRLKELQALPLERKVLITQTRIIEWYKHYNGQVYVSFSGGKDSTVLLHIVRQLFPDIEAVYVDTGLEYPELREFVMSIDNVTWLKPEMNFRQVLDKYGYPIISKAISRRVKDARSAIKKGNKNSYAFKMLNGTYTDKDGNLSTFNCKKWKFLIDAPFLISNYCCDIMKKKPLHKFDKETLKKPITGIMADESSQRRAHWLKTGCNAFDNKNPQSRPMSFWTENDVLEYIVKNELKICPIYGNIIQDKNGKYKTTALKRTGCMFCGYGVHLEKTPNRFERMKETHPKIWDYCIRPKNKGGLGMGEVLDFINVPYGKEDSKEKTDKNNED